MHYGLYVYFAIFLILVKDKDFILEDYESAHFVFNVMVKLFFCKDVHFVRFICLSYFEACLDKYTFVIEEVGSAVTEYFEKAEVSLDDCNYVLEVVLDILQFSFAVDVLCGGGLNGVMKVFIGLLSALDDVFGNNDSILHAKYMTECEDILNAIIRVLSCVDGRDIDMEYIKPCIGHVASILLGDACSNNAVYASGVTFAYLYERIAGDAFVDDVLCIYYSANPEQSILEDCINPKFSVLINQLSRISKLTLIRGIMLRLAEIGKLDSKTGEAYVFIQS